MDAQLWALEALAGKGRYAVTFRRPDGSEQSAIVELGTDAVDVADASLPVGWRRSSPGFPAMVEAVRAFDAARRHAPVTAILRDVAGGWDVSLGNVVLGASGHPECTAHGAMAEAGDRYVCAGCGAQATLGGEL